MASRLLDVAVVMRLIDGLTGPLREATAELKRFRDAARDINKLSVKTLRTDLAAVSGEIKKVSQSIRDMGNASKTAAGLGRDLRNAFGAGAGAISKEFSAVSAAVSTATGRMRGLQSATQDAKSSARSARGAFAELINGSWIASLKMSAVSLTAQLRTALDLKRQLASGGGASGGGRGGGGPNWGGGWNAPFPHNVPSIANRYLGWSAVSGVQNTARTAGNAVLTDDTNEVVMRLRAMPQETRAAVRGAAFGAATKYGTISGVDLTESVGAATLQLENPNRDINGVADLIARNAAALAALFNDGARGVEASYQGVRAAQILGHADTAEGIEWVTTAITKATIAAGRDVNPTRLRRS